jgi:hypothetical protein
MPRPIIAHPRGSRVSDQRDGIMTSVRQEIDRLVSIVLLPGRARVTPLLRTFFAGLRPGPMETARLIDERPGLSARLIHLANRVHHGAGIPVTRIEAATMRLGTERTQALLLVKEMAGVIEKAGPADGHPRGFWRASIARGCLARAMAMHRDERLAGAAFVIGAAQKLAIPLIAVAHPDVFCRLSSESHGCPTRLAVLGWQALGFNDLHVTRAILESWRTPPLLADAVGRHLTQPPATATGDAALFLWQVAFAVGGLPMQGSDAAPACIRFIRRWLDEALSLDAHGRTLLIRQAREEFADVADFFDDPSAGRADPFAHAAAQLEVDTPTPPDTRRPAAPVDRLALSPPAVRPVASLP